MAIGHGLNSERRDRVFGIQDPLYKIEESHREGTGRTPDSMVGLSYGITMQGCQSSNIPQADPLPTEAHVCMPENKAEVC